MSDSEIHDLELKSAYQRGYERGLREKAEMELYWQLLNMIFVRVGPTRREILNFLNARIEQIEREVDNA